jgi:hypothetical protein
MPCAHADAVAVHKEQKTPCPADNLHTVPTHNLLGIKVVEEVFGHGGGFHFKAQGAAPGG